MQTWRLVLCLILLWILVLPHSRGRASDLPDTSPKAGALDALNPPIPFFELRKHDVSSIGAAFWNNGTFGFFEYPLNSNIEHIQYGQLVFGCIRGTDTLVTNDDDYPWEFQSLEHFQEYSDNKHGPGYSPTAVSDQEFRVVFTDTLNVPASVDPIDLRPHMPIGLGVTMKTHAWSAGFARSIIIAEWWIKNISSATISKAVIGLRVNPAVLWSTNWPEDIGDGDPRDYFDNYLGFTQTAPGVLVDVPDTIELVWWEIMMVNRSRVEDRIQVEVLDRRWGCACFKHRRAMDKSHLTGGWLPKQSHGHQILIGGLAGRRIDHFIVALWDFLSAIVAPII
ncbi:MAG: hypothetical protein Kow0074_18420 [Candidatus Zixiibacteriota bacterium]